MPDFSEAAQNVGRWIGTHQGQLVYGGGKNGLMGIVSKATIQAGGRVVGIIPQSLVDLEVAQRDCHELHVVSTMHERKHRMAAMSDAFLALPGGIGTFEEFFEIWTWRQLAYHNKPVGLLNIAGYYDPLLAFMSSSVDHEFLSKQQMDLIRISNQYEDLLPMLIQSGGLTDQCNLSAA